MKESKLADLATRLSIAMSLGIIIITGVWNSCSYCFYIHLIPFALGFGGLSILIIILYYSIVMTILTLILRETIIWLLKKFIGLRL
jgi:hypothetical protein